MSTMGRKRNNPLGLPPRVYAKHGAFWYVHPTGKWERIGTDIAEARCRGTFYNDRDSNIGTMSYYLDMFAIHCSQRVLRGDLASRTADDYSKNIEPLKAFFGKMTPDSVRSRHVAQYLDIGAELLRPIRANREKSCLSACFTWLIRSGDAKANPCVGVRRNKETPRERYIEDEELDALRRVASVQVRFLVDLIYCTLQRPEDIIRWTPANIIRKTETDGTVRRVIRNTQGKTGKVVDIAVTPEIDEIFKSAKRGDIETGPGKTMLHTRVGKPYTYAGLNAMFRRHTKAAGVSFGLYDLKGKGATDMWLAGIPLERVQALCGHESIKTTEIYVKTRWRGTVEPNSLSNKKAWTP